MEREDIFSKDNFIKYGNARGFGIFYDGLNKPYNLNIWGVRSNNQHSGKFDDKLFIWTTGIFQEYDVTVDPSDIYLLNPIHKLGTAIIKPEQYIGVWKKGFHKNRKDHPALVQKKPITVFRDFNKDTILDFNTIKDAEEIYKGNGLVEYFKDGKLVFRKHTGLFGINCHRASKWKILEKIGLYSAGCVVHQDPFRYKDEFLFTIDNAIKHWGNSFTFTLITERNFKDFIYGKNS